MNFLLLSSTRLQDADCFFLKKAELEAKVESLKEEVDFLRMLYEEVRSLPVAAVVCISQSSLGAVCPNRKGQKG